MTHEQDAVRFSALVREVLTPNEHRPPLSPRERREREEIGRRIDEYLAERLAVYRVWQRHAGGIPHDEQLVAREYAEEYARALAIVPFGPDVPLDAVPRHVSWRITSAGTAYSSWNIDEPPELESPSVKPSTEKKGEA